MRIPLWIAWKELQGRKSRFILNISLVALAVGLCISMELISRSREQAVDSRINYMGPALRVVPEGVTEGMLTRYQMSGKKFQASFLSRIKRKTASTIYAIEGRLIFKIKYKEWPVALIGYDRKNIITPFKELKKLKSGEGAMGYELSKELKLKAGDTLRYGDTKIYIKTVLPTTGTNEDTALFVTLNSARDILNAGDVLNEIRIYPGTGVSTEKIAGEIAALFNSINVIKAPRNDITESGVETALSSYRLILYSFTSLVAILTLMIGSHINAVERKNELATLYAIGTTGSTVFLTLISRAFLVGVPGSLAGYLIGAVSALLFDFNSAAGLVWSWELLAVTAVVTVTATIVSTVPASIMAGFRNHVLYLQEDY